MPCTRAKILMNLVHFLFVFTVGLFSSRVFFRFSFCSVLQLAKSLICNPVRAIRICVLVIILHFMFYSSQCYLWSSKCIYIIHTIFVFESPRLNSLKSVVAPENKTKYTNIPMLLLYLRSKKQEKRNMSKKRKVQQNGHKTYELIANSIKGSNFITHIRLNT